MLYDDFKTWKVRNGYSLCTDDEHDRELFKKFYASAIHGMSVGAIVDDLAWQIYNLECCMEGVLEDL